MKQHLVSLSDIEKAAKRISPYIYRTPNAKSFSEEGVHFKLESYQPVRSFKIRGAANRILSLPSEKRRMGIVTASSGNHGLAVAYIAQKLGIRATIVLPTTV